MYNFVSFVKSTETNRRTVATSTHEPLVPTSAARWYGGQAVETSRPARCTVATSIQALITISTARWQV